MVGKVAMSRKRLDEDLKPFAELAVRMGAVEAKAIDPKNIIVKDWVRLKCQYGCGNYGNIFDLPALQPNARTDEKGSEGLFTCHPYEGSR